MAAYQGIEPATNVPHERRHVLDLTVMEWSTVYLRSAGGAFLASIPIMALWAIFWFVGKLAE